MNHWQPVYDFADQLPAFGSIAGMLLFLGGSLGAYHYYRYSPNEDLESLMPFLGISKRQHGMWIGLAAISLSGLICLLGIPSLLLDYFHTKAIYAEKQYLTVEGPVRNFDPMPVSGHKDESFTVVSVPFAFSDYAGPDYGYHNAASHGGVIKPGLLVRLGYFNDGSRNIILKLDTLTTKRLDTTATVLVK